MALLRKKRVGRGVLFAALFAIALALSALGSAEDANQTSFDTRGPIILSVSVACGASNVSFNATNPDASPVSPAIIVVKQGEAAVQNLITDSTGVASLILPDAEYFAFAKAENHTDGTVNFTVSCNPNSNWVEETPEDEPPLIAAEPAKEGISKYALFGIIGAALIVAIVIILLVKFPKKAQADARKDIIAKIVSQEETKKAGLPEPKQPAPAQAVPKSETSVLSMAAPQQKEITEQKELLLPVKEPELALPKIDVNLSPEELLMRKAVSQPFLRDMKPDEEFLLADMSRIKSLPGLALALKDMQQSMFLNYVTGWKNDFATWVYHAIGDHELAERMGPVKSKDELRQLVEERIAELLK